MSISEILGEAANNNSKRKRVGRGIASGKGKTCGRGHKGQKSRSGVSIKGFEGGQMPIHRRLPKYGFINPNKIFYTAINLTTIQNLIDNKLINPSKTIDVEALALSGVIKNSSENFKILSTGEIKQAITLKITNISKTAGEKILKAGGKILN